MIRTSDNADGLICGLLESSVLFGMISLACLAIITGCIWNLLTLWNTNADDSVSERIPIRIMKYGQLLWHGFYCALVITAAYVFRAVARQNNITIGGCSPSFATAGIVLSQVVIACIVVAYAIDIANYTDISGPNSSQEYMYAEVVFNYCMFLTGYFVQSILRSLFPFSVEDVKEEPSTDDDSGDDYSAEDDDNASMEDHDEGMEVTFSKLEQVESQTKYVEDTEEESDGKSTDKSTEVLPSGMTHGTVLTYFASTADYH